MGWTHALYLMLNFNEYHFESYFQMMPVTPYKIEITTMPTVPPCYYRVLVDGVKVKSLGLKAGVTK